MEKTSNRFFAIKCTFNDRGFTGTCSNSNIIRNIEKNRIWCSQPENKCYKYFERKFGGKRPEKPCYESMLFSDWVYGPGAYHHGDEKGQPIPCKLEPGGICIVTTRLPTVDHEWTRKIIGLFGVERFSKGSRGGLLFHADPNRIKLQPDQYLGFWDYHSVNNGPIWGSGLYRKLYPSRVAKLLEDLEEIVGEKEKKIISNFFGEPRKERG